MSGESKDNSRCTREFSQCGVAKTDPHAGDLREKCSPSLAPLKLPLDRGVRALLPLSPNRAKAKWYALLRGGAPRGFQRPLVLSPSDRRYSGVSYARGSSSEGPFGFPS